MKNKMRFSLLVAGIASLCNVAFGQSVDQGKKFLYYQRYKSAKDVFDKILASNPNNIDAVYYQGQALLGLKDSAAAEDLYSKALQSNGNAPLLLVGMGNIELRKGKTQDARQRFETAISLTKGKDVNVLNAIADANNDAHAGDAAYAIEKLNQATQTKNFNNPETYVQMGDAYRKLIDGGNAVTSYTKALQLDPKLAEAKFKIGKIYETQNNKEFFLPAFEDAITMDPLYAPAYYELYYYYYYHWDAAKAGQYLDKYIANTDPGIEVDIAKTDFLFVSGKFQEAKDKAMSMITAAGPKAEPRLYKMVAYACDTLGDVACAKQNINTYFQKQDTNLVLGPDYEERGKINAKQPDSATQVLAINDFKLAMLKDTLQENKQRYLAEASAVAKKLNDKPAIAELAAIYYNSKRNPNQNDLYNWGFANYSAGNYKTADSIFCGIYESKYPTEIFGYLWCKNSLVAMDDSTGSQGLAVDAYIKLADIARSLDSTAKAANSADSAKYRSQAVSSYFALAQYHNDIKKDKAAAVTYLQKILEVDPTNATAAKFIDLLTRKPAPARQPAAKSKAAGAR
jgi:tetratricopeptide (TPR) repeat protein